MKLLTLSLRNFRSYKKAEFGFGQLTVIVGQNGTGKSNLLEAIYLLAVGKSFRADAEYEMIALKTNFAIVEAKVEINSEEEQLRVTLSDGTTGTARKKFEVNGLPKRLVDAIGKLKATLFGPKDLEIITGSPSTRRKYLDFVLGQKDREYRRCLVAYEKGVRQRNKVLERIKEGEATRNQLFFWDKLLIKNGQYLTEARENYLENLTDGKYEAVYDKSTISEDRLLQYANEEVAAAATLVGPHRDDFLVNEDGHDVSKFGSRGQQRMAVLWLKLAERDLLTAEGQPPILLLDDIFSELDHTHREAVLELVEEQKRAGGQVIMTTADEHLMPNDKDWMVIRT
jgi:DNA replication and repair protein RecF